MSRRTKPLPLIVVAKWCATPAGLEHPPIRRLLAVLLASHHGKKGICPKQETLAKEVGLKPRTVRLHLKALGELFAVRRMGRGKANVYEVRPEITAPHQADIDRQAGMPVKEPLSGNQTCQSGNAADGLEWQPGDTLSGKQDCRSHSEHCNGTLPGTKNNAASRRKPKYSSKDFAFADGATRAWKEAKGVCPSWEGEKRERAQLCEASVRCAKAGADPLSAWKLYINDKEPWVADDHHPPGKFPSRLDRYISALKSSAAAGHFANFRPEEIAS